MHEISLAEGILQHIEDAAARESMTRVRTVCIDLGDLAGVDLPALRFAFDVVMRGSCAEGAALDVRRIPGTGQCLQCGAVVPLSDRLDPCPHCQGHRIRVTGGTDMRLRALDIE